MKGYFLIFFAVLGGSAFAGCGGSAESYSAAATRACLKEASATINADGWDYISHEGSGGSYSAELGGNTVTLGFFGTSNDAKRALASYQMLGGALDVPTSDVLSRRGNVTLSWDATPSSRSTSTVEGCLR